MLGPFLNGYNLFLFFKIDMQDMMATCQDTACVNNYVDDSPIHYPSEILYNKKCRLVSIVVKTTHSFIICKCIDKSCAPKECAQTGSHAYEDKNVMHLSDSDTDYSM